MKYFAVLLLLCFFTSCTITKRVHNPGWHVEWKSSFSKSKTQDPLQSQEVVAENDVELADEKGSHNAQGNQAEEIASIESTETAPNEELNFKDDASDLNDHVDAQNVEKKPIQFKQTTVKFPSEPRVDPLGILSIVSGSIALIFLLNICFLLSDNGWNAIFGLSYPWLFFIVLVFAVVGLILAIKSIKHIRQNPELYKRKNIAWTGFGISAASLGFLILALLILALIYLFETFFYW